MHHSQCFSDYILSIRGIVNLHPQELPLEAKKRKSQYHHHNNVANRKREGGEPAIPSAN